MPPPSTPPARRVLVIDDDPVTRTLCGALLREAGWGVVPVLDAPSYATAFSGKFDAVIMSRSYGYDNPDPIGYLQSDFGCAGSYNISRFCDRTIDADLADAATKTDAAARYRVAVDVEHRLLSTVAVIPLIHDRTQFGIGKGLTGLAEDPWERAVITVDTKFD